MTRFPSDRTRAHITSAHHGTAIVSSLSMRALVAAAAVAGLGATPAAALTPLEASAIASELGHPLTSMVHVARQARPASHEGALMFAPGGAPLPVYLNRFGGTYRCGNEDSSRNLSTVVCDVGTGTVGGFSGSDAQWSFVRDCVTDLFAPFNVYVTDLEPTAGDYVEAVVGGSPDEAGMPYGVGGVAPFNCDVIPNAIVYAFADVYGNDMQGVCETVAQEVAHAFGLDHEFYCADPMTYLGGCGAKTFQDVYAECGEFEPRACSCGGTSQNSVQAMLTVLGASDGTVPPPPPVDAAEPTVSLVSPADGAILPAISTITVEADASDDVGLTTVELEWDFTGDAMYCPATFDQTGSYACTRSGTRAVWEIRVGTGSRTFRVRVRDVAGNTATSDTRSIWLSVDGSGPPDDEGPPSVFVATPAHASILPANGVVEVVATIADDAGIARAELLWTNNGSEMAFPCPVDSESVSCSVNGTTHTWSLRVGEGARSFFVRATDVVGQVTESESRSITLREGATVPEDEDDDTLERSSPLACGESREGEASDADWYAVAAPSGQRVVILLDGEALDEVSLVATDGPRDDDVIVDGSGGIEFQSEGSVVSVAVVPERADAGRYSIEVACEDPAAPERSGPDGDRDEDLEVEGVFGLSCTQGQGGASWLGLGVALAALAPRARRRAARGPIGG